MKTLRRLILLALGLTFVVVVLGAYVRLSDAGLGCPDWPGCYGQLTPAHAADEIRAAESAQPGGPVSLPKAWKEMVHRYLAASLGLLILAIAALSWRHRRTAGSAPGVALALVGVVIFQGLLGKWTVTLLLKPAIVTGHLLGGMATLALLGWLALRAYRVASRPSPAGLVAAARLGLVLVVAQIALGGWTSTNYAALACQDFPTCHGEWMPAADFANAFHVVRELGMDANGELLTSEALTAIHWTHRLGALLLAGYLLVLAILMVRHAGLRPLSALLLAALGGQLALGIANVWMSLPLPLAVAHNGGAAVLLLALVRINHGLTRVRVLRPMEENRNANAYA
ncbi:MAG: COX15/CtaA family protein [Rhodocyclaceae bacterium]|nr:COX15/CtaA family protein [Rhodocyclaceae bacterium]